MKSNRTESALSTPWADSSLVVRAMSFLLEEQAVAKQPQSALAGLGEHYFAAGRYGLAGSYLDYALKLRPKLVHAAAARDTVQSVLEIDTFARRLGKQRRPQRARQEFDQAVKCLQACAEQRKVDLASPGSDHLQNFYAQVTNLQPSLQQHHPTGDSESVSRKMEFACEIEKAVSHASGVASGLDLTLLPIACEEEGLQP